MDVIAFNQIASTENSARRYLLSFCWKNHQRYCPRCRERKLYHVAEKRRRCTRCNYTFHDFSQRYIKGCAFTPQQWLWFLKLYEMDVPNEEMVRQLKVSYSTVLKARDILQRAILAQALDAEKYYEFGYWQGPGRKKPANGMKNSPVFGVMDLGGYIICDLLQELTVEDIVHFKMNFLLQTSSVGQVVYTAPYQQYSMLMACGPGLWPTGFIRHEDQRIPADKDGFWVYVKKKLKQLRGVSAGKFPLYLKEMELRYNLREESMLPTLTKALCGFVPECEELLQHRQ